RREPDTEGGARRAERRQDCVVTGIRATYQLGGDAAHPLTRLDGEAGTARDHLLPDERLETAAAAAGAEVTVRGEREVPELAPEAVRATVELTADDDPGAD